MGNLGFSIRNGDWVILVPIHYACGGFYWSSSRRVVIREEEKGSPQSGLGSGNRGTLCNDLETRSLRNDDLLFCPCFMVRKMKK